MSIKKEEDVSAAYVYAAPVPIYEFWAYGSRTVGSNLTNIECRAKYGE